MGNKVKKKRRKIHEQITHALIKCQKSSLNLYVGLIIIFLPIVLQGEEN